jgi:spore maturation protein SpmA
MKFSDSAAAERNTWTATAPRERTLARKLAIVLVVKLAMLLALWLGFVREQHMVLDADRVAAQLLHPVTTPAEGQIP